MQSLFLPTQQHRLGSLEAILREANAMVALGQQNVPAQAFGCVTSGDNSWYFDYWGRPVVAVPDVPKGWSDWSALFHAEPILNP